MLRNPVLPNLQSRPYRHCAATQQFLKQYKEEVNHTMRRVLTRGPALRGDPHGLWSTHVPETDLQIHEVVAEGSAVAGSRPDARGRRYARVALV